MFFDVAKINVKGGDGGNGCMAVSVFAQLSYKLNPMYKFNRFSN